MKTLKGEDVYLMEYETFEDVAAAWGVATMREGDKVKLIRFGQQGVSGSPRRQGESKADKARRASFKARHAKNIAKGKMSAAWWADKQKW